MPGQLPAFARLRALRDLDLQHLGIDQVFRSDAEAARSHLLDLGILFRAVAHRILAALPRIGARAQAVHRDRQRFMCLRRQCSERHARAVEARNDGGDGLNLPDRDGGGGRVQLQQIANARYRPLVDQGGEFPVLLIIARHHCRLQRRYDVRVVHMVLAAVHVLEQAALFDILGPIPGALRQKVGVGLQILEVRALNAAVGALEAHADDFIAQADDFEQLRAAIARNGRDAHFGHDLEQALADAAPVTAAEFLAHGGFHFQRALAHEIEQSLVREIGIDRGGAAADQAGEVMRVARRAGLHQNIALAAQPGLHQPVMHGAGGEQRVDRHLAFDEIPVGEQQHDLAIAHRGFRLIAYRRQGSLQIHALVVLQIDELVRHAGIRERHDLPQLALREHGR